MKIRFSTHANIRMNENRQKGITRDDVIYVASNIPGKVYNPQGFRIKNNISKSGKRFEVVIVDKGKERHVITVVGLSK